MIAVIGEALGNAPYKIVAPVLAEIQKQIDVQLPEGGKDDQVVPLKKQAE